jgi:transcriptional regulator with XRE-family HTH domain
MPKRDSDVCDQLRAAAKASGLTDYRIAKNAGVTPSVVSKFLHSGLQVRSNTFAKIAAALSMELRPKE